MYHRSRFTSSPPGCSADSSTTPSLTEEPCPGMRTYICEQTFNPFLSRAYWRWNHKYVLPKYSGLTPAIQLAAAASAIFYVMNYSSISSHKNMKYHW